MNRDDRLLLVTGALAAMLGAAAGVAEILAGTVNWAGNKNDPTTLGWVTVGLGAAVVGACALAARAPGPGAQLTAALVLPTCALVGLTTAGTAWIPAAIATIAAWVVVVRRPRSLAHWRATFRVHWVPTLVVVLAAIYLAFGIVARDRTGVLGIVGAVLVCTALAVRHRSRRAAAVGLVLAAVPFAIATAWSVVTPMTAVLMLAIGLPSVLDHSHTTSSREGAS
jgi:hypothetical protein